MFGRRAKSANDAIDLDVTHRPIDTIVADELPPIRAENAGADSGLADIESEFTISDADLGLLDLDAVVQLPPPLTGIEATLAEHRAVLDDFMGRLTTAWEKRIGGSVELQPHFMIPERCWEGEHREVLVEILGLAPAQPWNVLPLACDASTATRTGAATHPGPESHESTRVASNFIGEAIGKMQSSFEAATFGGDTVDAEALAHARAAATQEIVSLARHMAGAVLSKEAVAHSRATFFGD